MRHAGCLHSVLLRVLCGELKRFDHGGHRGLTCGDAAKQSRPLAQGEEISVRQTEACGSGESLGLHLRSKWATLLTRLHAALCKEPDFPSPARWHLESASPWMDGAGMPRLRMRADLFALTAGFCARPPHIQTSTTPPHQYVARPPERSKTAPVVKEQSSLHSQATRAAASSF